MKKLLTLFFTVLLAVASVRAEEPVSATPLDYDDNSVVINNPTTSTEWYDDRYNPSHYTLFSYTVQADGHVTIYSAGYNDTYGTLFDKDMNFIISSDDDGPGSNFQLEFNAKAGEVYYIGARGYGNNEIGSYTIHVDAPVPACEVGSHTMGEYVEDTPATCLTDGAKGHYECSTCHHKYSDAEGAEEITDLTIHALGHNMVDGQCTREGCGLVIDATTLNNGDNSVVINNPTRSFDWFEDRDNPSHYTLFKYTASANDHVTIYSVGDKDTYGVLFDKDMNCIKQSDNDGPGYNFQLEFDAKAGDVYYIGARGHNDDVIGSYTIHVDATPLPCEVGHHTMGEYVEGTPATCLTDGTKGYYECSTCHRKYSDAEGAEEVTDLTSPALGHNIADYHCTHEGCDLTVVSPSLNIGDNSVVINSPTTESQWESDRRDPSHFILFKYTVQADGHVTIYSVGDKDTYGVLYNKDMNWIYYSDDNGPDSDFQLEVDAKAGDVYYIGARGYGNKEVGSYTIHVDAPLPAPCEVGSHTMGEYVESTPATCLTGGTKGYYECSTCHHKYSDAEGAEEVTDLTIPALGHNIVDGQCTHEGCDYAIYDSTLDNGDNSVVINNPTTGYDWYSDKEGDSHYTLFKYTASVDSHVTIYAVGEKTTAGALFDKDMNCLGTSTYGYGNNFLFSINAEAGDVYYIGARGHNDNVIGSYTIHVDYTEGIPSLNNGDNSVVIHNPTTGYDWNFDKEGYSHYTLFSFTVHADGNVTIYADGEKMTAGALFDKDMNCLGTSTFDHGNNFQFEFDAKAGDVYYIGARGYDNEIIGSYTIHVDALELACEVGHHTMGEYVESTPATCTEDGTKGYYECSTCHHKYSDAEGAEEITDLTIPAFGHNVVDGQCTHEGCGYTIGVKPLTIGDNSVFIDNPTEDDDWWDNTENASNYTLFSYTAQADCGVLIYADGDNDTYGVLLDENRNVICESDDAYNMDFVIATDLKAGEVCYIGARGNYEDIGNYTIKVVEMTTPQAAIGDVNYYTLASAIRDAQGGETVTLIADIEDPNAGATAIYTYGTVTIDLNGYTMYGWVKNYGHLTIEDSSEGKTGKMITLLKDYKLFFNDESENTITINGGTFFGAQITSATGAFYINGGTFILPDESVYGQTMGDYDDITFGEDVVYRDLSGEHDDISEKTGKVTYSGTFVNVGTATAISPVQSSESLKTLKTIENGRIVIIRGKKKYDLTGREL